MWFGLGVTAFFLWIVLRDAPLRAVGAAIAHADWLILLSLSVPAYLLTVYLRALRWGHLTDPVCEIGRGALFRAVAVGFMANNVFPLRMGEVVRSWYLARETGASATALFGTVILERVIDTVTVVALAFAVFGAWGAASESELAQRALLLLPVALLPVLALVVLRLAPERVIAVSVRVLRPLPERVPAFVERALRRFSEGLGALRGGVHLVWIAVHSLLIWLVGSTIPFLAGFWALGIEFASPGEMLLAAWLTLAAVGLAVALPSAPGFFGPYHFACKEALERFGVPPETAVALGTLAHSVFWVTLTALGLLVLRVRRTSLGEIDEATAPAGGAGPS